MTKKEKFIEAIRNKKITDDKSALKFVLKEKEKEELIKEILPQVKGEQGPKGEKGGIGQRGEIGKSGEDGKDGKTPDTDQIITTATQKAIEAIKPTIPKIEDIESELPQLGKEIRDGLELLIKDERLNISAIQGLDDYGEISRLARQPKVGGIGGGSIARHFYQLFDTPENYSGQSGKVLSVKSDETGLEFTTGGLWSRSDTIITPATAGDDVNIGSGDLLLQDNQYLYFDTAKTIGLGFSTILDNILELKGGKLITSTDLYLISNAGVDGNGNYEPYIRFQASGVTTISNVSQGDAANRHLDLNFTDSVRINAGGLHLKTTGSFKAIIEADNIATSDKTFQFPNITGTLVTTNGALADIDIGAYDFTTTGNIGASDSYVANTYVDKVYLNSTAYLDGVTAGAITGNANLWLEANLNGYSPQIASALDAEWSKYIAFQYRQSADNAEIVFKAGSLLFKEDTAGTLLSLDTTGPNITVGGNLLIGGSNKELRFYEGLNYVGFEAPALAADQIWVLPNADGNANDALTTDGSGNLSWAAGATGATIELDNLGVVAINTSLISDTDSTDDLGSSAKFWANTYTDKLYFEANAFLQYENIYGGTFISGQSSSATSLRLLSKNDFLELGVRKSGALYGMSILANSTYGVRLSVTKAGGAGHFVIKTGTDIYPESDSSNDLGSSTLFWANIYTDLLHLSSTINIDGSLAGVVKFTGADLRPDGDSAYDLGATNVSTKDQSAETGGSAIGIKGTVWGGQTFTTGVGVTNISRVDLHLKKQSDTADTFYVDIFEESADEPTGGSLGQASIPAMTNTSYEWKIFTFDPIITVLAETKYVIVFSSPDSTGNQEAAMSNINDYADGILIHSNNSGVDWVTFGANYDYSFKTYTASDLYWAETYTDKLFLNSTATLDGATAGQITVVGDMIFSGSGSGLGFGEIYVRDNTTTTTLNSAAKVQMTIFDTNGESNSSTPDHTQDHITIDKSGKYMVIASVHVKNNASQSHVININVYKENGTVAFNNLHANRSLTGGSGDIASISISGIIDISATDTLELWADTDTAADRSVTFEDVTLSIIQIGS